MKADELTCRLFVWVVGISGSPNIIVDRFDDAEGLLARQVWCRTAVARGLAIMERFDARFQQQNLDSKQIVLGLDLPRGSQGPLVAGSRAVSGV